MFKTSAALALSLAASVLSTPVLPAPITVQSVLFDCDRNASTVGPPFGAATTPPSPPSCTLQPIGGNPPIGTTLENGAFTIFQTEADPVLGDGIDERTRGLFDFRPDANYAAFSTLLGDPHGKIFAATLQLVLTPRDPLFITDQFSLENGPFTGDPEIGQQLQLNDVAALVTIDLLSLYSQEQLRNFISGGTGFDFANDGRIVLQYGDDAIVSAAGLRLTANLPEPGTVASLSVALLCLFATRRGKEGRAMGGVSPWTC